MEIGHEELIQYCHTVSTELVERLDRMQIIVDYKLHSGTAYAEILRSFLDEHSAGKYAVGEGFIVNPFVKGASSSHCDVLVYDQMKYPLLDSEGDVKVILPRAAAMIIEVERNLNEARLIGSFENIHCARKIYPYCPGVVFAFNGLETEHLYRCMLKNAESWHIATAPIAIINVQTGFLAHRTKMTIGLGGGDSPFDVYDLRKAEPSIAFEFLLLIYFDLQMHDMLAPSALDKAWKSLLAGNKADYLGRVTLPT